MPSHRRRPAAPPAAVSPARTAALRILLTGRRRGASVVDALHDEIARGVLSRRDSALLTELVYGTVRHQMTLDVILQRLLRRTDKRLPKDVREILRLGAYQIVFLDRIPTWAAVSESVNLAQNRGAKKPVRGLVNATLRNLARRVVSKDGASECKEGQCALPRPGAGPCVLDMPLLSNSASAAERIGILHSHPLWLVKRWVDTFGEVDAEAACAAGNRTPSVWLHPNPSRTGADDLADRLRQAGVGVVERRDGALNLAHGAAVDSLPGYAEGLFWVQSWVSAFAVKVLGVKPWERVLDVCAAPGGKTAQLATRLTANGCVVALDSSAKRMEMLRANLERLRLENVHLVCTDAAGAELPLVGGFDRIVVDVPCSNTGVLCRRVDARWRLRPDDIDRLVGIQRQLLRRAAALLRVGGRLAYSTCSVEPEEGIGVVRFFLDQCSDFRLERDMLLLPGQGREPEGGYVAVLERC